MKKISNALIILISIALLLVPSLKAQTIKKVNFETIDQGFYSHHEDTDKQHIIEIYNQADWLTFWNQQVKSIFPPPPLPQVDFENYFIVVAIDEIRNSGGYTLEIKEITIDTAVENRPFEIILQLSQPGSAAGVTGALTRPYHIVKIEK